MHAPKAQIFESPLQKTLIAAMLAALGGGAFAQEAPATNYLGVRETVGRTSNVFVIPDGPHDYFYTTSLLGGLDKTYSRQHLYGTAQVDLNRYHNATGLNNTGYNVNAGWDWATIEKLSGSVTGVANQSLASLSGNASIPTTERNLAKADQLAATIRWGGEGLLALEGTYGHSRVSYSAPEYITQESSADTGSIGGFYRAGESLRLGLAGRFTRVYQPNAAPDGAGGFASETTDGKNLDLTADWKYSAQTNVNGRLSYTRQTFSGASSGDGFSGLTGAIYANYVPTAKLSFSAALLRDAGINSAFFNVIGAPTTTTGPTTSTVALSESSQTTNTAVLGLRYAATAKIAGTLGYQYRNSKSDVATGPGTTGNQTDKLQTASLGLTYDFDRNWQLACAYSHQNRDVSGVGPFSYVVNTTNCSAQFLLR